MELTEQNKTNIDNMSHYQMCARWRFAPLGDEIFRGETGAYFKKRLFDDLGGFTPEISKSLGWGNEQDF